MPENPEESPQRANEDAAPADDGGKGFWRRWKDQATGDPLRHPIATRPPARPGNTLPLVSLAPRYSPEHHRVYADLLERALRHPDTRSVALTGSYGSGKSSVLNALRRHWWSRRVITKLSLSTLNPKLEPAVPAENPAEREASNRIQKELVKQLLYQLPPRRTPRSRFQRASSPSWWTGALVAVVAAVGAGLVWVVTTLAGWQALIAKRLDEANWTAPWFWGGVTVGLVILALAAWWTLAGRYTIQAGLKAGPLVVRLELWTLPVCGGVLSSLRVVCGRGRRLVYEGS